ncbi:MAG: hypothetical protein KJ060_14345, partial [Candidatus Hydrogenedentes bacterium]|nr:hypothetical protein [Candidatus Hydrogenedentota bacterium]
TIAQLGELIAGFPDVRFMCFLASRHGNQSLCTLARELPNLSLAGYWWHNFFPGAIRQVMEERLDMLPTNKQIGFFSDAYCAEWSYAKAVMVRKLIAEVLAGKIALGQYGRDDVLSIARGILHDSSCELLGMKGDRGVGGVRGATGFQPVSLGERGCDLSGASCVGEDLTRLAGQDARPARGHGLEGHGTSNLGQDAQATSQ